MGRKKRKVAVDDDAHTTVVTETGSDDGPIPAPSAVASEIVKPVDNDVPVAVDTDIKKESSGYAMTSHSGEVIQEDIYVSDGSESGEEDAEGNPINIVLAGSKHGLMRRGLHHHMVQPKRQWSRPTAEDVEDPVSGLTPEQRRQQEEEELAKLDPAERAARLLQEKQRKLEEAKELARRKESEENAGRDSMLFSKRTAFDIRFDQIEDKPWLRGNGDVSDFFNYGLTEEEWLEYSEQQLLIRQELIDARRQKRKPDPTLVPVTPREPSTKPKDGEGGTESAVDSSDIVGDGEGEDGKVQNIGPDRPAEVAVNTEKPSIAAKAEDTTQIDVPAGYGGAWGAGAAPGSMLAKLIEAQEEGANPVQGELESQDQHSQHESSRFKEEMDTGLQDYDSHHGSNWSEERSGDIPRGVETQRRRGPPDTYENHDDEYKRDRPGASRGRQYDHYQANPHPSHYGHQPYGHGHHPYENSSQRGRGHDRFGGRGGRGGGFKGDHYGSRKRPWEGDGRRRR